MITETIKTIPLSYEDVYTVTINRICPYCGPVRITRDENDNTWPECPCGEMI